MTDSIRLPSYESCKPGDRFDLYLTKADTSREWLYRVVCHMDDSYVYLHEPNKPVDVRVNRRTQVVYQWKYGGWETSDYQEKSDSAGYLTLSYDGMTGDEEGYWLCWTDRDPGPGFKQVAGAKFWSALWKGNKELVTKPWIVNVYCTKAMTEKEAGNYMKNGYKGINF